MEWNPDVYDAFSAPRLRPALDLLGHVPATSPRLVVDLGCGTGDATRRLAVRWPGARVIGFDRSAKMLEKARATATEVDARITWVEGDIAEWSPDGDAPDVVYSNAALHWLPGHEDLFPRLFATLAPGGWLAVQMPKSFGQPSHWIVRDVLDRGGADGGPLGPDLLRARMGVPPVADARAYRRWLADAALFDAWETTYLHLLEGEDPVLRWIEGTTLRPVLAELDDADRQRFLETCATRLREAYPPEADGCTPYPFSRLFVLARRR